MPVADPRCRPKKETLRDTARQRRSLLSPEMIREKSRVIGHRLLEMIGEDGPVLVYVSKPQEVSTREVIDTLAGIKTKVVVPIIQKDTRTLRLSYLTDPACLVESTFHVPEPIGNEVPAEPRDIRTVIVPLLAFDRGGHRLGYGAGYYDRFLEAHPHLLKIGLAFACQEVTDLPADAHDIRMDVILTEDEHIDCRK